MEVVKLLFALVAVTVMVASVGGVTNCREPQALSPAISSNVANIRIRCPGLRFRLNTMARSPAKANGSVLSERGMREALVAVPMVTVIGTDVAVALNVAGFGFTEHMVPAGTPEHAKLICPLNPLAPLSTTLKLVEPPGETDPESAVVKRLNGAFAVRIASVSAGL